MHLRPHHNKFLLGRLAPGFEHSSQGSRHNNIRLDNQVEGQEWEDLGSDSVQEYILRKRLDTDDKSQFVLNLQALIQSYKFRQSQVFRGFQNDPLLYFVLRLSLEVIRRRKAFQLKSLLQ